MYLENCDKPFKDYRKLCVIKKITGISLQDRNVLKDYLTGAIDTCPQLDLEFAAKSLATDEVADLSGNPADVDTTSAPQLSTEEIQEQKKRRAALIDQSIQRPATVSTGPAAGR